MNCKVPDSLTASSITVSRSQAVGQAGSWCLELSLGPCLVSGQRNAHMKEKWDLRGSICLPEVFAFPHQSQRNPKEPMLQMAAFKCLNFSRKNSNLGKSLKLIFKIILFYIFLFKIGFLDCSLTYFAFFHKQKVELVEKLGIKYIPTATWLASMDKPEHHIIHP